MVLCQILYFSYLWYSTVTDSFDCPIYLNFKCACIWVKSLILPHILKLVQLFSHMWWQCKYDFYYFQFVLVVSARSVLYLTHWCYSYLSYGYDHFSSNLPVIPTKVNPSRDCVIRWCRHFIIKLLNQMDYIRIGIPCIWSCLCTVSTFLLLLIEDNIFIYLFSVLCQTCHGIQQLMTCWICPLLGFQSLISILSRLWLCNVINFCVS